MIIGERLRDLREQKKISQGEVEKRTGLLAVIIHGLKMGTQFPAWKP
jgi:transcriptional regulator with XRE-family HTH domain